jgi:hypothetical protein
VELATVGTLGEKLPPVAPLHAVTVFPRTSPTVTSARGVAGIDATYTILKRPCLPAALEWGITAYDALYVLLARDFAPCA